MPTDVELNLAVTGGAETEGQFRKLNEAMEKSESAADKIGERMKAVFEHASRGSQNLSRMSGAFQDLAKQGLGEVSHELGKAIDKFALFSHAQEQLNRASRQTAAEQKAAQAAQTQAFLAEVSKRAAIRALEEGGEGLAALATGIWPPNPVALAAAAQHFAAAGVFGALGGGAALGANAIGQSRGNTQQENQQLAQARSSTGAGTGSSGGGGGGGGDARPLVINFTSGGLFMTPAAVAQGVQQAQLQAARLS
jgi:hypothetical protein